MFEDKSEMASLAANVISGNRGHGVEITGGSRFNAISSNLILENRGNGVVIAPGCHASVLIANRIIDNSYDRPGQYAGVHIRRALHTQLTSNVFADTGGGRQRVGIAADTDIGSMIPLNAYAGLEPWRQTS
jgi:hypothetical protein